MKFFKNNVCVQQEDVKQARRFTLGQYIAAVISLLLSVTAISYAAGLLTLNAFRDGDVISSKSVNDNFDYVQANLNVIAASMVSAASSVQASTTTINTSISNVAIAAATDATTKANNAQAAAIAAGLNQYTTLTATIPAAGTSIVQSHSIGNVNFTAALEFVCITADQDYVAGDVVQVTRVSDGSVNTQIWKTSTQVGASLSPSGAVYLVRSKSGGTEFTPVRTSWAYRFALRK